MYEEKEELATAFLIGFLLNRIVTLPTFRGDTVLAPMFSQLSAFHKDIWPSIQTSE